MHLFGDSSIVTYIVSLFVSVGWKPTPPKGTGSLNYNWRCYESTYHSPLCATYDIITFDEIWPCTGTWTCSRDFLVQDLLVLWFQMTHIFYTNFRHFSVSSFSIEVACTSKSICTNFLADLITKSHIGPFINHMCNKLGTWDMYFEGECYYKSRNKNNI